MKGLLLQVGIGVLSLILSACTVPVFRKEEMRDRLIEEFVRSGDYANLARYWDEHAQKLSIDLASATFLTLRERERKAEITVGTGPYYGMIELIQESEGRVTIRAYAWGIGGIKEKIQEWISLLRNAP